MRNSKTHKSKQDLIKEIIDLKSEIAQLKDASIDLKTNSQINSGNPKKNKNLFLSIFEDSGIAMVIINKNYKIIKFNKVFSALLGYSKEEIYSMTYFDILPENAKEDTLLILQDLFASKQLRYEDEQILIKKDKSLLWNKLTATIIHDEYGFPEYIIGMGENITEFKRQKEIRDSVYNISNAVNNSDNLYHLIVQIKDFLKTVIDSRHFFISLYNAEDDTFSIPYLIDKKESFNTFPAKQSLAGYVSKNKKSTLLNYTQILNLEKSKEILIIGKLPKQWLGVPLLSDDKVIGVIGMHSYDNESAFDKNDLTIIEILSNQISSSIQKKRSEDALKLEQAYFKELYENSPEAIAIVNNSSVIIDINREFTNIFGYSKDEAINKEIETLISSTDSKDEALNISSKIVKGEIIKTDTKRIKKDGSSVDVSIWGTPIIIDNGQVAVYAIFRDITDQVEYKQELKEAKEKAEESDKLKTAFLTNMSHEIRTPMNAIIGFSDLIADPDADSETRKEFSQQIYSNSKILLKLIDDIIDISQIDTGKINISNKKFNVSSVLFELLKTFQNEKSKELKDNIDILLHNPYGTNSVYFETDDFRFKQIFEHLLNNALKYTHQGFIEFGFDTDQNDKPTFYVRDTGIGILKDKKELIFKPFTKIEDLAKLYRGTGIGLTITQKLVKLLGGKLWVESNPGIGSIFYFSLPNKVKLIEIPGSIKQNLFTYNWNGKNILIAEDEDTNFAVLKASLSRTYAKISRVTQGDQAVEFCKNNSCDIILMDIKMPVLNGIDATKQIRLLFPNLPIIAQTAYVLKNERDTCLDAGCNEYIPKPLNSSLLLKTISKFID